jgi:hypothetical protein
MAVTGTVSIRVGVPTAAAYKLSHSHFNTQAHTN